jgi:hypothetical protein
MSSNPFVVPSRLASPLARAMDYWQGLRRAENEMPFWDNVNLSKLSDVSARVLLIDVFSGPARFRLNTVGSDLSSDLDEIRHRFLDELKLSGKLIFLRAQASATVEAFEPTFLKLSSGRQEIIPTSCFAVSRIESCET